MTRPAEVGVLPEPRVTPMEAPRAAASAYVIQRVVGTAPLELCVMVTWVLIAAAFVRWTHSAASVALVI